MLEKIKLLKDHNGRKKGTVLTVDPLRGARMIDDGTGKSVGGPKLKPKPKP